MTVYKKLVYDLFHKDMFNCLLYIWKCHYICCRNSVFICKGQKKFFAICIVNYQMCY